MGGGGTETTTNTSGPTNPMVDRTTTKLLTGLQGQVDKGTAVFNKSLYPGMSGRTQTGINATNEAALGGARGLHGAYDWANSVVGSSGYNPALSGAQSGVQQYLRESQADAPGYAAVRARVADDAGLMANATFTNSGRFGGGTHREGLGEGIGNALAGMDLENYENRLGRMLGGNQALAGIGQTAMGNAAGAASAVPGLYNATLLPGQTQIATGQMLDADALATRQGENDLFRRQNDSGWSTLGQATSILAGNAGAGTQQNATTTPTAPWWQQALGAGAIGSGIYKNIWGT